MLSDAFTKPGAFSPRAALPAPLRRRRCPRLMLGCLGILALAALTPVPVQAAPPGGAAAWTQTFGDEFNDSSSGSPVDGSAWIPQPIYYNYANGGYDYSNPQPTPNYNPGRYNNDYSTVAYYLPENVTQSGDGFLDLTQRVYGQAAPYTSKALPFSSAFLITRSFQQAYGYFEVRMKPGTQPGLDPTFWLIHNNSYPEIDIAEFPSGDNINIWGTAGSGGNCVNEGVLAGNGADGALITGTAFNADFHVYGLDWEPDHMTWYIDGVAKHTTLSGNFPIPSDPMNVVLSVQMQRDDNSWFGDPFDARAAYPNNTQVDWVRVWQKNPGAVAGGAAPVGHRIGIHSGVSSKFLSVNLFSNSPDLSYLQAGFADSVQGWEMFDVVDAGNGNIALKSEATGKYVTVDMNQSSRVLRADWATAIGDWEPFQWADQGNGVFALKAAVNGLYVSCNLNDGSLLEAQWAQGVGSWEQFTWVDEGLY